MNEKIKIGNLNKEIVTIKKKQMKISKQKSLMFEIKTHPMDLTALVHRNDKTVSLMRES